MQYFWTGFYKNIIKSMIGHIIRLLSDLTYDKNKIYHLFHKTIISFRNLKTNLRTNFIRAYIISYIANCNILAQGLYTFCLYFDILDSVSIYLIKVCTDSKNNSRGIRRIILITGLSSGGEAYCG